MKWNIAEKIGKFIGTLLIISVVILMVCVLVIAIALTTKFVFWLF